MKKMKVETSGVFADLADGEVGEIDGKMAISIDTEDCLIALITRQNAKDFFGLVEPPTEDQERLDFEAWAMKAWTFKAAEMEREATGCYVHAFV